MSEWGAFYAHVDAAKPRVIVAPKIPANEIMRLRAHVDEAITDPDYSVVLSYECRWDEYADIPDSKPTCMGWKPYDNPRKS